MCFKCILNIGGTPQVQVYQKLIFIILLLESIKKELAHLIILKLALIGWF